MLVMRKMILETRPTFLGPTASVGGFYLGPIYYWMAAPFLALWRFDPVGPSYMVAAFGVATVLLLYKFLKNAVGFWPAIISSSLYSVAPLIVQYSRSSWNPNPLPFFALLLIYFLYLGLKNKKLKHFFFAGLSFGVAIQLHYLAVTLIPVIFLIIIVNNYRLFLKSALLTILGSLVTFSPFLIFEIKHNFPNFKTILEFVTRPSTHGYKNTNFIWLVSNLANILLEDLSKLKGTNFTKVTFWILTAGGVWGLFKNWHNSDKKLIFSIGVIWFLGGLFFLRYYTGQIFNYYFGFMFPAPFLLFGLVVSLLWQKLIAKITIVSVTLIVISYFITNSFYKNPPNKLIDQTEQVADFVIEKSQNKPYNFALITDHNSDHAYRYFLEIKGYEPIELETLVTDQLLVVCEGQSETNKCAPLGHPIWEIAGFGRAEIEGEWTLPDIGVKVLRLTHWPGAPSPAGKPAVKGR